MRRSIVLLVVLAFALTLVAVPVSAGPHEPVSGDWTYVPDFDELIVRPAGPNVFISGPDVGTWEPFEDWTSGDDGYFDGTSEEEFVVICHPKKGFSLYKGEMTFDGKVVDASGAEHEGTMVIKTNGKQNAVSEDCGPVFDEDWHGHWVIIGGTGDLANIHGHGTFEGPSLTLTYKGQIHFS